MLRLVTILTCCAAVSLALHLLYLRGSMARVTITLEDEASGRVRVAWNIEPGNGPSGAVRLAHAMMRMRDIASAVADILGRTGSDPVDHPLHLHEFEDPLLPPSPDDQPRN